MRNTIRDIAKLAGVSVTTVSLILNGKGKRFKEDTISRVKSACQELNYTQNLWAASLSSGRSNTIGLLLPDIRNPFFTKLAESLQNAAYKRGYSMILANSNDDVNKDQELLRQLAAYRVAALLYCPASTCQFSDIARFANLLEANDIPHLYIDRYYPNLDAKNCLHLDHFKGAYLATEHLINLGHRKLACLAGPLNLYDVQTRIKGMQAALSDYGVETEPLILDGGYKLVNAYTCCAKLLKKDPEAWPTAFFACNDLMALGCLQAIKEAGCTVPKDFSIIGYDDIFPAQLAAINLTTIRQPVNELGEIALARLLDQTATESNSTKKLLPELIIRASTSQPRN